MKQLILQPEIHLFSTCEEFAKEFNLCEDDLIITNEYIFNPNFAKLNTNVQTIFQEKYGTGEPTDVMIDTILKDLPPCKRIIALGGGTVIDIAKVVAVSNGQNVDELYENVASLERTKELIIVPTTCGTGSEVTNLSIINRTRIGTKVGLASASMYANSAVLIPELMKSLPFYVFATSSIDALVHAVESVLSPKATDFTKLFGYKAIDMILNGYKLIRENGPEARQEKLSDFLVASTYAGISFGTAGCAAVHATSYPLGGTYHVPHGESNYAMFTGVLYSYIEQKSDGEIAVLNKFLADILGCDTSCVYEELENLLNVVLPKKQLREYGMTEDDIQAFASTVVKTQGRLLANNFVQLSEQQIFDIYKKLY